jgi:hypothetical protein
MSLWLQSPPPLPACRLPPVTHRVPAPTLIGCELLKSEPTRGSYTCLREFPAKRWDYTSKPGPVNILCCVYRPRGERAATRVGALVDGNNCFRTNSARWVGILPLHFTGFGCWLYLRIYCMSFKSRAGHERNTPRAITSLSILANRLHLDFEPAWATLGTNLFLLGNWNLR